MKLKASLKAGPLGRGKCYNRQPGKLRCQLFENQEKVILLRRVMTYGDDVINVIKRGVVMMQSDDVIKNVVKRGIIMN